MEKEKITQKALRKEFEELTGKGTEIPGFKGEPITFTQSYVHWLEKKILAELSEVKEPDSEEVIKGIFTILNSPYLSESNLELAQRIAAWIPARLQPAQSLTDEQIEKYVNEKFLFDNDDYNSDEIVHQRRFGATIILKAYRDGIIAEWLKQKK